MKQPISQRSKKNWDKKAAEYMAIQMSYSVTKKRKKTKKKKKQ